ncbi:MAG: M42 family metallopeptidase [Candidatus Helarchaeota archaeon]
MDNHEKIKSIFEAPGIAGQEQQIRSLLKSSVENLVDEVHVDALGNLLAFKVGVSRKPVIMIAAHMDSIGFMINYIDENGFLRIVPVGGISERILPSSRLLIYSRKAKTPILGVIGEKAIHLMDSEERKKLSKMEDLFVDIGVNSKEEAEKFVSIGDFAIFQQTCEKLLGNRIVSKSLDDRVGCIVGLKTLEMLKTNEHQADIVMVFTVQEEIGTRGAITSAFKVNPDLAFVLEVNHGVDFPGSKKEKDGDVKLGGGPKITLGPNIHPKLSRLLIDTAEKNKIPYQVGVVPRPLPNDGRSIQVSREGVATALIGVPLRYMHTTSEVVDLNDVENAAKLLAKTIQKIDKNLDLKL